MRSRGACEVESQLRTGRFTCALANGLMQPETGGPAECAAERWACLCCEPVASALRQLPLRAESALFVPLPTSASDWHHSPEAREVALELLPGLCRVAYLAPDGQAIGSAEWIVFGMTRIPTSADHADPRRVAALVIENIALS